VNVSAVPRPVSFAFATAVHSIMVERQADRDRIHTDYTAPEKYLETELAEELRANEALLSGTGDGEVAGADGGRVREASGSTPRRPTGRRWATCRGSSRP
jgi:hypothetical protein